jgi:ubiquinone/menaquinone biosynthesis C-methylase UbiE
VLGDSLHPGGLALTSRLAAYLGIRASSDVLDAGSGLGATAVHLSRTIGCRVTGVTLEDEGIAVGSELARREGVEDRVSWVRSDIQKIELEAKSFDFILVECVLSIIADKAGALRRLHRLLKPGGRLGLTDVTVSGTLPSRLQGLLATVGCVGGALSPAGYRALLEAEGYVVERSENCGDVVASFLHDIKGKLMVGEVVWKLGKLPIDGGGLAEAQRLLESVEEQVERGVLGYGLLVARKPA